MPAHPFAEIFPLHDGQPIGDLAERIQANGQRDAIVLHEGRVLDGRRRELACLRAGVQPQYREFGSIPTDGDDPLEFVIDRNLYRRHLGEGERAMAAAKYAKAKAGNPKIAKNGENAQLPQVAAIGPPPTRAQAAQRFETSEAKVERAKKVIASGTEKLQEAVDCGIVWCRTPPRWRRSRPRCKTRWWRSCVPVRSGRRLGR
jgi:hypothetical protein